MSLDPSSSREDRGCSLLCANSKVSASRSGGEAEPSANHTVIQSKLARQNSNCAPAVSQSCMINTFDEKFPIILTNRRKRYFVTVQFCK